jgi:capsular polysaccharide export protein
LLASGQPFYVLPLQLNSDAQIRDHSRFANMAEVLAFVLESFARHAPANTRLVVKNHPLDIGWTDYPGILRNLCSQFDLGGRVDYLETADLAALLRQAQGMVTVNSTAGSLALGLGCPTIALSDPIYNLPKLCFQGGLDDFWLACPKPDAELFRRFRNVVIHATQPNGGFYSPEGIALAVANSVPMLTAERSVMDEWL